jgi:hypothetical protein
VAKIAMLRHSVPAFGTRWIAALSFRGIGKSSALANAQACRLRSEEQSILPPINQDFKSGQSRQMRPAPDGLSTPPSTGFTLINP